MSQHNRDDNKPRPLRSNAGNADALVSRDLSRDLSRDFSNDISEDASLEELLQLRQDINTDLPDSHSDAHAVRRSSSCLSMPRLRTLSRSNDAASAEVVHLESCALCSARLTAFGLHHLAPAPTPIPFAVRGWSAAAAAAVIAVGVLLFLLATSNQNQPSVPGSIPGLEVARLAGGADVEAAPTGGLFLSAVWIEEFERVSSECSVVAFVRAWDESCACLRWRQHHWVDAEGESSISQTLESGDLLEVHIEMPGATPPVEQLVLVATARNAEDLPTSEAAAQKLLSCLAEPQCLDDADAIAAYVSNAPGCFGEGVRLIPRAFVVK